MERKWFWGVCRAVVRPGKQSWLLGLWGSFVSHILLCAPELHLAFPGGQAALEIFLRNPSQSLGIKTSPLLRKFTFPTQSLCSSQAGWRALCFLIFCRSLCACPRELNAPLRFWRTETRANLFQWCPALVNVFSKTSSESASKVEEPCGHTWREGAVTLQVRSSPAPRECALSFSGNSQERMGKLLSKRKCVHGQGAASVAPEESSRIECVESSCRNRKKPYFSTICNCQQLEGAFTSLGS